MYGYGYYSMFDPTMILVLIGVFLSLGASAKVNSTYARFSRVRSMTGMTGAEAARQLLNSQGIYDVQIRQVAGSLTDHYDPRTKTVNLSESVYGSTSVAAIGVAAHECGHAMQDASEYVPLRLRGSMVPVVNIGAQLAYDPDWCSGRRHGISDRFTWNSFIFLVGAVPACDASG